MNILVTGVNGFVGKALSEQLRHDHNVYPLTRSLVDIDDFPQIDVLIHLAGRAHVLNETATDVYQAYADVNVGYTLKVAMLAKRLNVKRLVYLSSVKVNGEVSKEPFNEKLSPKPLDDYGLTKYEAELGLKDLFSNSETELVVIRPPLIYGKGVKANVRQLMQICKLPIPLPFGAIHNKRSLVSLDNLIDFIELCCTHPSAANQTFMISDDADVSTTELIASIRMALNMPLWLVPIPQNLLWFTLKLLGKKRTAQSLLGNLQIDITKAKSLLGWKPVISFDEGIRRMAQDAEKSV